jgi:uncharacterized membrane protein YhaH (DUF805 family)
MGIGRWFSFAGRIRRRTWWLGYVLPILAISILGTVIDVMLGFVTLVAEDAMPADGFAVATSGFGPFSIAALLVTIVGGLAGQVKRWHDRDKSGWWVLIALIPIVGPIWALVELGFLSGTEGPNRFGPDPRGGAGAPQWQPVPAAQGWQPGPPQWQQPPAQPQWQPPPAQGWQPPAQGQGQGAYPPPGWQPPPQGYPPPQQGYGQPPPGYGQPPPGHGQPPPGYGQPPPGYGQQQPPPGPWQGPGPGGGSVPPVRRD